MQMRRMARVRRMDRCPFRQGFLSSFFFRVVFSPVEKSNQLYNFDRGGLTFSLSKLRTRFIMPPPSQNVSNNDFFLFLQQVFLIFELCSSPPLPTLEVKAKKKLKTVSWDGRWGLIWGHGGRTIWRHWTTKSGGQTISDWTMGQNPYRYIPTE